MNSLKSVIIPFLSVIALNVLQIYKDLQPVLFDVLQILIAVLTVIYLVYKIRNEKQKYNTYNDTKKDTKQVSKSRKIS